MSVVRIVVCRVLHTVIDLDCELKPIGVGICRGFGRPEVVCVEVGTLVGNGCRHGKRRGEGDEEREKYAYSREVICGGRLRSE